MTKAGTGDILSGLCGSFLAMGMKPLDAACSAAFVSGLAGELAAKKFGQGLLASDLLALIPRALQK